MSKNSRRRKKALEDGLEILDQEQRKFQEEKDRERLNDRKEIARPSLLKKIGAALLDFLFAGLFATSIFAFSYFVIFPSTGYQDASQRIIEYHRDSSLFVLANGKYERITSHYDDAKTPEENFDVPITYFYKTNAYAIKNNQLKAYNDRKLASNLYVLDENENIVRKEGIANIDAKNYLIDEYKIAVDYFFTDPQLNSDYKLTYNVMFTSLITIVIISAGIFYYAIPLVDKTHATFGYKIAGLIPVNSEGLTPINWKQVLLRSTIFVIITYISPLTMYILFKTMTFSFIPFFINTAILCFSHSNSGLHDYASKVVVINKSYSNPFESLKAITGEDKNN